MTREESARARSGEAREAAARRRRNGGRGLFRAVAGAVLATALVAGVTACSGTGSGRPTVVVTTNILGDITRNVIGDEADVKVLMKPNADPHSFGVSARQAAEIERADLVVYNGLGLEENVLRHVESAEEAGVATLAVADSVDPIPYASDESEGEPDPHFWTDPHRVRTAVGLIREKAAHIDGVDTGLLARNAKSYGKSLRKLSSWMERRFDSIPRERRNLVTNHHVFGYLAQRFDFEVIGAVIPSGTTLASPSAADLESLSTAIDRAGVRAVFADSSQPKRLARVLKRESDLEVSVIPLYSESLTPKGGGAATYEQMMRANTRSIAEGLAPG